jgi:dolichol-phosphate mannosyltransferase
VKEEETLVKFVIVGASGTVINLALSYLLHFLIEAEIAQAIGVEISIVNNFFWNDSFTFKEISRGSKGRNLGRFYRLLKYNLLSIGTATLNLLVFYFMAYPMGFNYGGWYLLSSFTAVIVSFIFNYLGSLKWAWKGSGKPEKFQKSAGRL